MKVLLGALSIVLAVSIFVNADSLNVFVSADSLQSLAATDSIAVSADQQQGGYIYLDSVPTKKHYKSFHGEKVVNSFGYGIYYSGSSVSMADEDSAMVINFSFKKSEYNGDGGWISVRKAFNQALNLGGYSGVAMEINTKKIIRKKESDLGYMLRLTLCDIGNTYTNKKDPAGVKGEAAVIFKHWKEDGFDYMWWSKNNFFIYKLSPPEGFDGYRGPTRCIKEGCGWVKVRFPFSSFDAAFGGGTRNRPGKIDPYRITAYEICILGGDSQGNLLFRNVRAYKK